EGRVAHLFDVGCCGSHHCRGCPILSRLVRKGGQHGTHLHRFEFTGKSGTDGTFPSFTASSSHPLLTRTPPPEIQSKWQLRALVIHNGRRSCPLFAIVSRADRPTGFRRRISPIPDAAEHARPRFPQSPSPSKSMRTNFSR